MFVPKQPIQRPSFSCAIRPTHTHSLMAAVEAGNPDAQFELGRTYWEGRAEQSSATRTADGTFASFTPAVRRDLAAATELLQKAADQGHEEAARLLAVVRLHTSTGVH